MTSAPHDERHGTATEPSTTPATTGTTADPAARQRPAQERAAHTVEGHRLASELACLRADLDALAARIQRWLDGDRP